MPDAGCRSMQCAANIFQFLEGLLNLFSVLFGLVRVKLLNKPVHQLQSTQRSKSRFVTCNKRMNFSIFIFYCFILRCIFIIRFLFIVLCCFYTFSCGVIRVIRFFKGVLIQLVQVFLYIIVKLCDRFSMFGVVVIIMLSVHCINMLLQFREKGGLV